MERGVEPDDAGEAAARDRSERLAVGEQSCSGVEGLAATAEEEEAEEAAAAEEEVPLRRRMNRCIESSMNFERLVLGCIDADFCK